MSKAKPQHHTIQSFIRGYWEVPTSKPLPLHSFLRGALLSVALSLLFFGADGWISLVVWALFVGAAWVAIDVSAWKYYEKQRGE